MKKAVFLAILLSLCMMLSACGCNHKDNDYNGACDSCGKKADFGLCLIDEDGEANFQFVIPQRIHTNVKFRLHDYVEKLSAAGITVDVVNDTEDTVKECEVLIGTVSSRGEEYVIPDKTLGDKGYVVRLIKGKVVLCGGSPDAIIEAITAFIEDILKFDGGELGKVVMHQADNIEKLQSQFPIKSFTICGEDVSTFTIAGDKNDSDHKNAALAIQSVIYENTGHWLPFVDISEAGRSIILKKIPKVYSDESFRVYTEDSSLVIECAFGNRIHPVSLAFFSDKFKNAYESGTLDFEGELYRRDVSFVTYKEFGAVGDAKTNDFLAIFNAHSFANLGGQRVIIDGHETYYISTTMIDKTPASIPIQTDVYWNSAKFIIDDSALNFDNNDHTSMMSIPVFVVLPGSNYMTLSGDSIPRGTDIRKGNENLGFSFGYNAAVIPVYSGHKIFRRRGVSRGYAYRGTDMTEIIVIDKDGNVSDTTPVLWSYPQIDSITVHNIDDTPITLSGGIFTTLAPNESIYTEEGASREKTFKRGILIKRSNTTLKSVMHYMSGEISLNEQANGRLGMPYSAFFTVETADSVTFDDCFITARRCYQKPKERGATTTESYEVNINLASNVTFESCRQRNFFVNVSDVGTIFPSDENDKKALLSGARLELIGGARMHYDAVHTLLCKNLIYKNSTISSFTGYGLYGGKIINSTVSKIDVAGFGELLIEGSTQYLLSPEDSKNSLVMLNEEYGASWDGEIGLINHTAYMYSDTPCVINYPYVNWYNGYVTAFPSLELNRLCIYDTETKEAFEGGDVLYLTETQLFIDEPALNLDKTLISFPYYSYEDNDRDGYVDRFDKNLDGALGPGDEVYNPSIAGAKRYGVYNELIRENLNPVKAPVYVKMLNNTQELRLCVIRTDERGFEGGFFGNTKFYYAPDKYYTGTGEEQDESESSFKFKQ